jgi:hypothetical protein
VTPCGGEPWLARRLRVPALDGLGVLAALIPAAGRARGVRQDGFPAPRARRKRGRLCLPLRTTGPCPRSRLLPLRSESPGHGDVLQFVSASVAA